MPLYVYCATDGRCGCGCPDDDGCGAWIAKADVTTTCTSDQITDYTTSEPICYRCLDCDKSGTTTEPTGEESECTPPEEPCPPPAISIVGKTVTSTCTTPCKFMTTCGNKECDDVDVCWEYTEYHDGCTLQVSLNDAECPPKSTLTKDVCPYPEDILPCTGCSRLSVGGAFCEDSLENCILAQGDKAKHIASGPSSTPCGHSYYTCYGSWVAGCTEWCDPLPGRECSCCKDENAGMFFNGEKCVCLDTECCETQKPGTVFLNGECVCASIECGVNEQQNMQTCSCDCLPQFNRCGGICVPPCPNSAHVIPDGGCGCKCEDGYQPCGNIMADGQCAPICPTNGHLNTDTCQCECDAGYELDPFTGTCIPIP